MLLEDHDKLSAEIIRVYQWLEMAKTVEPVKHLTNNKKMRGRIVHKCKNCRQYYFYMQGVESGLSPQQYVERQNAMQKAVEKHEAEKVANA